MIRFATNEDILFIMNFIDTHWRKGHIMSRDKKLFEFQHLWQDEVSFVIAEEYGEMKGILGFIPYDSLLQDLGRDITLAIWKTIKSTNTMLGVDMLRFLLENGSVHNVAAPGINPKTMPIYNFFGYQTGEMTHWYRACIDKTPKIAQIHQWNDESPLTTAGSHIFVKHLDDFEAAVSDFNFCSIRENQLYKSLDFIKRRYYNHPYFQYKKYGFIINDKELIIIFRVQSCNGSNALRIIDCIGDHEIIQSITPMIDNIMKNLSCEYVDCYEAGISDTYFEHAGWKNVANTGDIIPEYFSPFEQKNVSIFYMTAHRGTFLFKGDGDMDRPN